jgi:phosphate transport system protein
LELKQTGGAIHTHLLAPPVSPSNPTIFKSAVEGPHQRFPKGISFREERPAVVFSFPTADCVNAGREAVTSISKAARRNISIRGCVVEGQKRHFEQELDQLRSKLLAMSALVESAVYYSIAAVVDKDRKLAEEVLQGEARVNRTEIEIDEHAISLLALHQPVAGDLRLITAALKINTDLERMGDLAVNIAERALSLLDEPVMPQVVDIPQISALVQNMVRKSLDAFVSKDATAARSVLLSDDAVDALRSAFFQELISFMRREPNQITQAISLLSIVRNLERIADHATNIAEDVLFYVKGIDVRHHAEEVAAKDEAPCPEPQILGP